MNDEVKAMRVMSPEEMAQAERDEAIYIGHLLSAYLAFPTSDNFDLVTGHMRGYQTTWMNGRVRS